MYRSLKKILSIFTLTVFLSTNVLYAAPSFKIFKNNALSVNLRAPLLFRGLHNNAAASLHIQALVEKAIETGNFSALADSIKLFDIGPEDFNRLNLGQVIDGSVEPKYGDIILTVIDGRVVLCQVAGKSGRFAENTSVPMPGGWKVSLLVYEAEGFARESKICYLHDTRSVRIVNANRLVAILPYSYHTKRQIYSTLNDIAKVQKELARYNIRVDDTGTPVAIWDEVALDGISNVQVMRLNKELADLRERLGQLLEKDPVVRSAMVANKLATDAKIKEASGLLASMRASAERLDRGDSLSSLHEYFAELKKVAGRDGFKATLYIKEATGNVAVEEASLPLILLNTEKEILLQYLAALIHVRGMINGAVEVGLVMSHSGNISKEEIQEVLRRDFGKTESFVTFGKTINFVDGELKSAGAFTERAGREAQKIDYNKGESLGFDVGGQNIKVALKKDGKVIFSETISLERIAMPLGDFIEAKVREIEQKFDTQLLQKPIYITIPGPVTPAGEIIIITNLENTRHGTQASLESLKSRFSNIRFQNDANVATFYEMAEDPKLQGRNVILTTLGTGTGLGVVVNGELLKGPMESHIKIDFSQEAVFHENFGMKGDLESYTNADFVVRRTKELIKQKGIPVSGEINPKVVAGWLSKPDAEPLHLVAKQVYTEFGENLVVLYKEISRVTGVNDWNVVNTGGIAQGKAIEVIIEGAKVALRKSPDIKVNFLIREDAPMRGALGAADLGLQEQQIIKPDSAHLLRGQV